MGLFIYVVWTLRFGFSAFGGALALACLMLPIVIRATEEMLRLVPDDLREASYALGARKSRTILTVVLPAALPGIVSRLPAGRGPRRRRDRAAAVHDRRRDGPEHRTSFNGANTALSIQIFGNATSPFAAAQERAWGAALTLIALTFVFTVVARAVSSRFALKR